MKKSVFLILTLVLMTVFAGCASQEDGTTPGDETLEEDTQPLDEESQQIADQIDAELLDEQDDVNIGEIY